MGTYFAVPYLLLSTPHPHTLPPHLLLPPQEHVHQAFDDVLNYEEFSIRLNVADMPNLVDILKAVTPEQIMRYRQKM